MIQVAVPNKKDDGLGKALTIGGAVVGGVTTGTPAGAVAGAGAGQTAAGLAAPAPGPQPVQTNDNAMSRRIQSNDNLRALRDAQDSLSQLPKDTQAQYQGPINQAYAMELKRRGM